MKTSWDNEGYGFDPYEQDREDNAVNERSAEEEDADGEEMMANLHTIREAAKQARDGSMFFLDALRRGGFFGRPN